VRVTACEQAALPGSEVAGNVARAETALPIGPVVSFSAGPSAGCGAPGTPGPRGVRLATAQLHSEDVAVGVPTAATVGHYPAGRCHTQEAGAGDADAAAARAAAAAVRVVRAGLAGLARDVHLADDGEPSSGSRIY
jgi:hypothetical protein